MSARDPRPDRWRRWAATLAVVALASAVPGAAPAQAAPPSPPRLAWTADVGGGAGLPAYVSGACYRSGAGGALTGGAGVRVRARRLLFAEAGARLASGFAGGDCVAIGCPSVQVGPRVTEERCGPRYSPHVQNPTLALDARAGVELPLGGAGARSRLRVGAGGGYLLHVGEPFAAWTVALDTRLGQARWSLAFDRWHHRLGASEERTRTDHTDLRAPVVTRIGTVSYRVAQRTTFVRVSAELPLGR